MSEAQEATIDSDGSTGFEAPPMEDTLGAGTGLELLARGTPGQEDVLDGAVKGTDPIDYVLLSVTLAGALYYYIVLRKKRAECVSNQADDIPSTRSKPMGTVDERIAALPRDCIKCDTCKKPNATKPCCRCHKAFYCSDACQERNVSEHEPYCHDIESRKRHHMGLGADLPVSFPTAINKQCYICLSDHIEKPIVLENCKHAFCASCLIEWQRVAAASTTGATSALNCPICRSSETSNAEDTLLMNARKYAARANRKGLSEEEQKKYREQALEEIDKVEVMNADHPMLQTLITKAEILRLLGDPSAAMETVRRVVEVDEERHAIAAQLSELLDRAKAAETEEESELILEEAQTMYDNTRVRDRLSGGPERHVKIRLVQAKAYQDMQRWKEALQVYGGMLPGMNEEVTSGKRELWGVFIGRSRCFYETGEYDMAIQAGKRLRSRQYPGGRKYMALAYKAQGKLDKAIETMNMATIYETPWDDEVREENLKLYEELVAERENLASA